MKMTLRKGILRHCQAFTASIYNNRENHGNALPYPHLSRRKTRAADLDLVEAARELLLLSTGSLASAGWN
jgi:hypothetical protein